MGGDEFCDFCYVQMRGGDEGRTPDFERLCPDLASASRCFLSDPGGFAVVAIGPIRVGNSIVFARPHAPSVRDLPDNSFGPFKEAIVRAASILMPLAETWAIFEHGNALDSPERAGGCVEHAHVQLMPTNPGESVIETLSEFDFAAADSIDDVRDLPTSEEYLFVQDGNGSCWISEAPAFEGQIVRKAYAALDGDVERWNWRKHPRCEMVLQTTEQLARATGRAPSRREE